MTRDQALEKVRKLAAMTTGAGASEAEAMAAMAAIKKLLADYNIAQVELTFERRSVPFATVKMPVWGGRIGASIAHATGCAAWHCHGNDRNDKSAVIYFGRQHRVEIAEYLHDVAARFIINAVDAFRQSPAYRRKRSAKTKREALEAYQLGLAKSLGYKIARLNSPEDSEAVREADEAVKDLGMTFKTDKPKTVSKRAEDFLWQGERDGSRANILNGVKTGTGPVALIGGGK